MLFKSYLIENNFESLTSDIVLFFGENLGLKNDFKNKIREKNKNYKNIKLIQEDIIKNNNLLIDEIINTSLFDEKKIIIIDLVSDKILEIIKELENKISDQKIYLFADLLDKKSKLRNYFEKSKKFGAIPCYQDNEISIKKLIKLKLHNFKGLTTHNINLILENCNLDRSKLSNELIKIELFFQNKTLETDKLENLLNATVNDDFNKLKDEAMMGNRMGTNKLLSDTVFENEKNILYLNSINQRLNKLLQINSINVKNVEEAIDSIKPPIFWKDKPNLITQAKKWNKPKIRKVLNKTYDVEKMIKSNSTVEKNILIKKLIVDICNVANS